MTAVTVIYDAFFGIITDDQYMEMSEEQTHKDCRSMLMASLPLFEFPEQVFTIIDITDEFGNVVTYFEQDLTLEEINILATGMNQIWLQRQLSSIEQTRQKFTGADFKMTSQASHLQRLMVLYDRVQRENYRLQVLYSRREKVGGRYESTFWKMVHKTKKG